jgi:hypothetical protein
MRMYDIYRYESLAARMRVLESGEIEWAYRQGPYDWQGFWWRNDIKAFIEELIVDFPEREKLIVSEFTILRCRPHGC